MKFNLRTSDYSQAGKAAADDLVRSFAAARRNSPDFGKMAQNAASLRSKKKIEGINAAADVTQYGIRAAGEVASTKIKESAKRSRDSAKRKAGALATAGKLVSSAGTLYGDSKDIKLRDTSDSQYQTGRMTSAQEELEKATKALETFNSGVNPETGKPYSERPSSGSPSGGSTPTQTGGESSSENSGGGGSGGTVSADTSAQHTAGPGKLSKAQIKDLALAQGFTPEQASIVVGIAGGESGFDPSNSTVRSGLHAKTGEDSVGLMQINWGYHKDSGWLQDLGITSRDQLFDPATNLKAAKYLHDGRGGFGDWTVYEKGIYQDYL